MTKQGSKHAGARLVPLDDLRAHPLNANVLPDDLRAKLPGKTPDMREAMILEEVAKEIKSLGGKYVLPFTFKNASGKRTSHKLVFVSKNFKGYEIMKDIMA